MTVYLCKISDTLEYLGIIISDSPKSVPSIPFVKVTDKRTVDGTMPTLIIGRKTAEEMFGSLKVLNRKIKENVYWTFSKRERRVTYEEDLERFKSAVDDFFKKNIKYTFYNPLTESYARNRRLVSYLNTVMELTVIKDEKFLYCFDGNKNIFGFLLENANYAGISSEHIERFLRERKNIRYLTLEEARRYLPKNIPEDKKIYIPYFLHLKKSA